MNNTELLKIDETEKYRHYKGGIYYKLAKAVIVDDYREINVGFKLVGEAVFEDTCEPMLVLSINDKLTVCFKDRESTAAEYIEDVILYQSEKDDRIWVRFKEVFEEEVEPGVLRFAKID